MASIQLGGSVGTTGTPILGAVTIVNLDATYTLSVAEYTNNYITVTGTLTAQRNIVAPLTLGVSYIVNNLTTGGQNVQFIGSSGTGVVIASGTRAMVVTDGTNYNLVAGSTTNFSAGGDLSGTNTSQQVISLTGAGGVINVASTGNIITWATATTSPGLKQTDQTANSTNGQALKIQAQNSTGTSTVGGQLILASGTGTSASGGIFLNSGTSSLFSGDTGSITLNTGTNLNLDIGGTPKLVISSSAYTLSSLAGSGAGYVGVSNTGVLSFSSTANPGGTAGGDLSGTYPNPVVSKLQTNPIQNTVFGSVQDGYVLTWVNSSTQLQAKPIPTQTATGTAGGDLLGTYPNPSVVKIQGKTLSSSLSSIGSIQDGYILTWVNGSSDWEAKPISSSSIITLSGDVTGTTAATIATQARGLKTATTTVSVSSATAPTTGQVLTATSGTAATWQNSSTFTAGGDLTGTSTVQTVGQRKAFLFMGG